jgi:hypothetical protein
MQQEPEVKILGDKNVFAIEIKEAKAASGKYYLRYIFNNTKIGDFKKAGYIDTTVSNYASLMKRLNHLYEDAFDGMTHKEIFDSIYLSGLNYDISLEQENALNERMMQYNFNDDKLGNSLTMGCYYDKAGRIVFLIYKMDGTNKPKFYSFVVELEYFKKVYEELINFLSARQFPCKILR